MNEPWDCRSHSVIGRTKDGMNSQLHAVTDATGRPLRMFLTTCQRSDDIGALALLDVFARRIVGWRVSTSTATQFVLETL